MTPLEQARQWIADQVPSKEEIQETIDNLCHVFARPPDGVRRDDVYAAIGFLMDQIGGDVSTVVLPEVVVSGGELDTSPLGSSEPVSVTLSSACMSNDEKLRRFRDLQANLRAPF